MNQISARTSTHENQQYYDTGNRLRLTKRSKNILRGMGAVAGITGAVLLLPSQGGSPEDYSRETVTVNVEPGDTLIGIASEVDNVESADIRNVVQYIKQMPENASALQDGLQAGEQIVRPDRVDG